METCFCGGTLTPEIDIAIDLDTGLPNTCGHQHAVLCGSCDFAWAESSDILTLEQAQAAAHVRAAWRGFECVLVHRAGGTAINGARRNLMEAQQRAHALGVR